MKWAFWLSLQFVVFTYAGYPLLLYVRARLRRCTFKPAPITPHVSIVMAVRNEAERLSRKLRDLSQIGYPPDRYEIVVVSDGATDATNQILRGWVGERRSALICTRHEGKAAALNRAIQATRGEIVVFTDARQLIEPEAVKCLVADFADPSVGCVSGDITLGDPKVTPSVNGFGLYWKIETSVRRWEGATGSLVGAAGCLYAVRRELLVPLPAGTILDDVYLPLHVARQGARVVFEPKARGWDCVQSDRKREFRRKVRTLLGLFQLLRLAPWVLSGANPLRFEFVCHKLLRLLVPLALLVFLVSSLFLRGTVYEASRAVQLVFYCLAALPLLRVRLGILSRLADFLLAFLVLNTAAVVALVYFVLGKKPAWGLLDPRADSPLTERALEFP